jgi:serine/threonine-protein kinase RsbW/stage II sporulation protein AB (anti-sigma F factor)
VKPWERHIPTVAPEVIRTLRREAVAYARLLGASDETCDAVALAVSEALTNVVQHAYVGEAPGAVTAEARLERRDQLLVRISDDGRGPIPRADSPGLGLGLGVMAQSADDFSISNRHGARGTVVTLRFSLRGQDTRIQRAAAPGRAGRAVRI